MEGYHVYMSVSLLLLSTCLTRGENCTINPECTCSNDNGGIVLCSQTCGPNTPKFAASSVHYGVIKIVGRRYTKHLQENSFQGLITNALIIQNTGISDIPCNAWSGLEDTLTSLYLDNNYLTSVPTCSLHSLANLAHLSLEKNKLTVISREAFRGLSSLRVLKIGRNNLVRIELNGFKGLKALSELSVSINQLTHLDGSTFRGIESLAKLSLDSNSLSVLHPMVFSELKKLRDLNLDDNNMTSVESTLFQDLTDLRFLYMRNNRICSLPESVFLYNTELNGLYLSGNCLASLHENLIQTNSKLYTLHLDKNDLTNLPPGVFRNLANVNSIYLQGNSLTEIEENIFDGCPNIGEAHLNNNNINTLRAGTFRNLTNFRTLDLSHNNLKVIDSDLCVSCPALYNLDLSKNHIYFMHEMSLSNHPQLYQLKLDQNNLSSSSWTWLLKVISRVPTVRRLDLSHNPIETVPSELFNLTENLMVTLRNCSLNIVPDSLSHMSGFVNYLDISSNKLQNFGSADSPQSVSVRHLNVSNNNLASFDIRLSSSERIPDYIHLRYNLIQIPIFIRDLPKYVFIYQVDLSHNNIQNVTQFPINVFRPRDTQPANPCDHSSYFRVSALNLSRNAISFIPPEACLGIVYTLDLSYNQLTVLGKLMPSNNTSTFRLRRLYISGNNIHQVSPYALGSESLYAVDIRFNNIRNLEVFEKTFKDLGISRASFLGNPINCDCSLAWLRNDTIPVKLDSARCQSPFSAKGFLVFCYPLSDCPAQEKISISDNTRDICENDSALVLFNLTVTWKESIAGIFWTKTGPGMLSGYELELRQLTNKSTSNTLLIHPDVSNTTVVLEKQHSYIICISAQLHGRRVSNELCKEVTIRGEETFCAGVDVVIGLSACVAGCLATAVSLVISTLCRRKVSNHKDGSNESGRPPVKQTDQTRPNTNMYLHEMKRSGSQSPTEELYEDLDLGEYVNSALEN